MILGIMSKNKFSFGAIWVVPDETIKFPKNLFRTNHNYRTVVIVENSKYNYDKKEEYILIAPLSSQLKIYDNIDIFLNKDKLNNLEKDSFIRMRAIQFIPKSSCKKYIGKISDEKKHDIYFTLQSYINNN